VKVAWSKQVKREGKTLTSVGARFVELHLGEQIKLLQYFLGRVQDPETNGSDQPHSLTLGEQRETPSSPALIKSKEEQVKPAIPTVQAVPSVQSGRIFLAFHNGYRRPVTVNAVAVIHGAECLNLMKANGGGDLPANAKIHYPLLDESRQLVPGGTERVDITDKLFSLFNEWWWRFKGNGDQVSERQRSATRTRMIGIGLTFEPQPLSQPEQTYYRVTLDNGDFTSVSPAHDGNRKQERVAYPGGFTKLALRD